MPIVMLAHHKLFPAALWLILWNEIRVIPSAHASTSSIDPFERSHFDTLPPTVFAPTGRLHMVDRVGLAASNYEDVTAGLVVALRCGSHGDDECIVVVGTGPRSPLAMQAAGLAGTPDQDEDETLDLPKQDNDDNNDTADKYHSPLLVESIRPKVEETSLPPSMSILSPGLVVAAGGSPSDAAVFLDRVRNAASNMHNSNYGGTGFTFQRGKKALRHSIGLFGVDGANLARNIADMVQIPTQSVGTRMGSMLAASALILDAPSNAPNQRRAARCKIWRIDPSGQFWSCDAAAVGRGAGMAESFLLKEIARIKGEGNEEDDARLGEETDVQATLTNEEVKKFLGSLSEDVAIELAQKCVLKVYGKELTGQKWEESSARGEGNNGKKASPTINFGGVILHPARNFVEVLEIDRSSRC